MLYRSTHYHIEQHLLGKLRLGVGQAVVRRISKQIAIVCCCRWVSLYGRSMGCVLCGNINIDLTEGEQAHTQKKVQGESCDKPTAHGHNILRWHLLKTFLT